MERFVESIYYAEGEGGGGGEKPCDGLATHPRGDTPSGLMLRKPE